LSGLKVLLCRKQADIEYGISLELSEYRESFQVVKNISEIPSFIVDK
jgi:hypothetical protein